MENKAEIIMYTTSDGITKVNVTFEDETVWLIQEQMTERQAEREQAMTMKEWAKHLDRILTMSGEQLLQGNGSIP